MGRRHSGWSDWNANPYQMISSSSREQAWASILWISFDLLWFADICRDMEVSVSNCILHDGKAEVSRGFSGYLLFPHELMLHSESLRGWCCLPPKMSCFHWWGAQGRWVRLLEKALAILVACLAGLAGLAVERERKPTGNCKKQGTNVEWFSDATCGASPSNHFLPEARDHQHSRSGWNGASSAAGIFINLFVQYESYNYVWMKMTMMYETTYEYIWIILNYHIVCTIFEHLKVHVYESMICIDL